MPGVIEKLSNVVAVPVKLVGRTADAAGKVSTAVVVGSRGAVNETVKGLSGAGIGVVSGAKRAITGTTGALANLLKQTGRNADGAVTGLFKGGRRNTRKNKNRSNKNRSNKNRKNKNRSNKNRSNKNRSNKNRNRH
jgi:hypothetical protein